MNLPKRLKMHWVTPKKKQQGISRKPNYLVLSLVFKTYFRIFLARLVRLKSVKLEIFQMPVSIKNGHKKLLTNQDFLKFVEGPFFLRPCFRDLQKKLTNDDLHEHFCLFFFFFLKKGRKKDFWEGYGSFS
jgi:hypothetical protein